MPALIPLSYSGTAPRIDSSAPHCARLMILGACPGTSTAATKIGSAVALGGWTSPDAAAPKPSTIGAAARYWRTSSRKTAGVAEPPPQSGTATRYLATAISLTRPAAVEDVE